MRRHSSSAEHKQVHFRHQTWVALDYSVQQRCTIQLSRSVRYPVGGAVGSESESLPTNVRCIASRRHAAGNTGNSGGSFAAPAPRW